MTTWHQLLTTRIIGLESNVPKYIEDKKLLYQFCIDHHISTPEIYHTFDYPNQIDFKKIIQENFVLKPSLDSSGRGVMILNKENDGFFDILSNSYFEENEIIDYQNKYFSENANEDNKIIIQEKVTDFDIRYKIPRDFKFYVFNGELSLILVIDRNYKPAISLWYDKNFQPITDGRVRCVSPYVRTLTYYTPPIGFEVLIDFATNISKLINTPFASIDIYKSTQGPMLGEITLTPGGIYYGKHYLLSDEQEIIMGKMWLIAQKQLSDF